MLASSVEIAPKPPFSTYFGASGLVRRRYLLQLLAVMLGELKNRQKRVIID